MTDSPNPAEVPSISACTSTSGPLCKSTRHTVSWLAYNKIKEEKEPPPRTKVVVVVWIARAPVRRALRTVLERLVAVADAVDRIGSGGQRTQKKRGNRPNEREDDSLVEPVDLLRLQEQRRGDRMDRSIWEEARA